MSDVVSSDAEDIETCAKEGRRPRDNGPYRIQVADALMRLQAVIAEAAVHSGRELLELAALSPAEEYVLLARLTDGLLEEVRLEETIDLRAGVEKFLAFRSDRIFRLLINGREFQWGAPFISGATVLTFASDAGDHGVWLQGADGTERTVAGRELVDLSQPGVERFVTRPSGS